MNHSRCLKVFGLSALGLPVLFVVALYFFSFIPHLSEIDQLTARGEKTISGIENVIYPLAISAETKVGIRAWAMRQSYLALAVKDQKPKILFWHANNALWLAASYLHFNDRRVFGLWVECAIANCNGDLNSAAFRYFGRPLTSLTEIELAEIIGSIKSPKMFAPGTDVGRSRAKALIENAKDT